MSESSEVTRWLEDGFVPSRNEYVQDLNTVAWMYIRAILWAETDESGENGGEPLENTYGVLDMTVEFRDRARRDVRKMVEMTPDDVWRIDPERFGYDLWLTRQHHGAGFWGGDWDKIAGDGAGERLTKLTHRILPETYVYVGDDGILYFAPEVA